MCDQQVCQSSSLIVQAIGLKGRKHVGVLGASPLQHQVWIEWKQVFSLLVFPAVCQLLRIMHAAPANPALDARFCTPFTDLHNPLRSGGIEELLIHLA